jgi:hypothetical protein
MNSISAIAGLGVPLIPKQDDLVSTVFTASTGNDDTIESSNRKSRSNSGRIIVTTAVCFFAAAGGK